VGLSQLGLELIDLTSQRKGNVLFSSEGVLGLGVTFLPVSGLIEMAVVGLRLMARFELGFDLGFEMEKVVWRLFSGTARVKIDVVAYLSWGHVLASTC